MDIRKSIYQRENSYSLTVSLMDNIFASFGFCLSSSNHDLPCRLNPHGNMGHWPHNGHDWSVHAWTDKWNRNFHNWSQSSPYKLIIRMQLGGYVIYHHGNRSAHLETHIFVQEKRNSTLQGKHETLRGTLCRNAHRPRVVDSMQYRTVGCTYQFDSLQVCIGDCIRECIHTRLTTWLYDWLHEGFHFWIARLHEKVQFGTHARHHCQLYSWLRAR